MFYDYRIVHEDGEEILYLYLTYGFEFAQDLRQDHTSRQRSIYERVINYIKNRGIDFQGNKVYLVVNDIIVSSLILGGFQKEVDRMIPVYKYVEVLRDFFPNDMRIDLVSSDQLPSFPQEKFIDLRKSNGILERVRLEEYIMGVLQFELPYTTPMETLKAQAVLARTYVYRQEELGQELSQNNGTQLYQDQTYLKTIYKDDYLDYFHRVQEAVFNTRGEYLSYQGEPIQVYYHVINHGKTEDASEILGKKIPYLVSVDSNFDRDVKGFSFEFHFTYEQISRFFHQPITKQTTIKVIEETQGGSIKKVQIGSYIYRGTDIQRALHLQSNNFVVTQHEDSITFTCHRIGQGLGLSIYGAIEMAKHGYSYEQILRHYYPNTEILKRED